MCIRDRRETTAGTYVAPEKFVPINSESLKFTQDNVKRRPIRANAGLIDIRPGNSHIEGEIEFDVLDDILPYFLYGARMTLVKSGAGPYVYTFTPNSSAVNTATKTTLSLSVKRNSEVFGYTGCVVTGGTITVGTDGVMKAKLKITGLAEATQSALSPTWPTTVPFSAGQYDLQIPTSTSVTDGDTFEFTWDDGGEAQFRLNSTGRGARFIKFGEHSSTLKVTRDFADRTDYDTFKNLTSQAIKLIASQGANDKVTIDLYGAIKDSYDLSLSNQGDLVRAEVSYDGVIDSAGKDFTIVVTSSANIT